MQTAILKCKAGAQFHFGKLGLDENMSLADTSEYIHSDTLFSAIINEHSKLFGDKNKTDAFVKAFENREIKISSAFYALNIKNNPTIYFFPRPITATFLAESESVILQIKKIKKIQFVSAKILETGKMPDDWLNPKDCTVIQDKFICTTDELNGLTKDQISDLKIYSHNIEPKVRVHTAVKGDTLYNQANIQIADNRIKDVSIDFFFLYKITKEGEKFEKVFKKIIHSLMYSGIGGQRSTGTGLFEEAVFSENNFKTAKSSSISMNISLIIPGNKNFINFKYYDLITRGGRRIGLNEPTEKGLRLQRIRMVKEGAIINNPEKGTIENIAPQIKEKDLKNKEQKKLTKGKYLRNGTAFSIPINIKFDYDGQ